MAKLSEKNEAVFRASVDPGVCGFPCVVEARKIDARKVAIRISGSGCQQIQTIAALLEEITLQDLFAPRPQNPVFLSAQQAGCHLTCIVPLAVLKAAEAALGMALPRGASIKFTP